MTQDCLYLRRLKKYGNFTKAAESLGVSQPYFSQKIARLEKNYKVPLVDRHTLPVTLTRAGELVLATEQRIYELREDCNKQILDLQAGTRGSVALGASPACMECLLPLALPQLAANLPEITVTVREGNPEALRRFAAEGAVDFSLLLATGGTSELDTISVREENILVAVPATAPRFSAIAARPGGKTVSFREFDALPFIAPGEGGFLGERLTDLKRLTGSEPDIVLRTGSPTAALALCEAGIGAALTTASLARGRESSGKIRLFELTPRLKAPDLCAVFRNDRYLSQAALAVIAILQKASA